MFQADDLLGDYIEFDTSKQNVHTPWEFTLHLIALNGMVISLAQLALRKAKKQFAPGPQPVAK